MSKQAANNVIALILLTSICIMFQTILRYGVGPDFDIFYRAAYALRSGINPYTVTGFYSPIYLLVYYLPFTTLDEMLAYRINVLICTVLIWLVLWHFSRHSIWMTTLCMLSGCVAVSVHDANNDWMVFIASITNPIIGLWLAFTKPQIGLVLAALLIVRRHDRMMLLSLIGIILLFVLSILAGMPWGSTLHLEWNRSVFPMMLPFGLLVAYRALSDRRADSALLASPLIAPYVGSQSWFVVLPYLMQWPLLLPVAVGVSWLIVK
jgi:hypothetical protein